MTTTTSRPAPVRATLPPALPGEVLPRRDHAVRLFWIALPGMLPVTVFGPVHRWDGVAGPVLALVLAGAAVGVVQAGFCWRWTVPATRWVPFTALGWATGAVAGLLLGAGLSVALRAVGIELRPDAAVQVVSACAGAGAGWNAASLQSMVLRRQGRAWKWWLYASAGAAALGAVFPHVFF